MKNPEGHRFVIPFMNQCCFYIPSLKHIKRQGIQPPNMSNYSKKSWRVGSKILLTQFISHVSYAFGFLLGIRHTKYHFNVLHAV